MLSVSAATYCMLLSTQADRQGVDISVTVCFFCNFVCVCVCTVEDFSAEDTASTVVYRCPGQRISHFRPETQNRTNRPVRRPRMPAQMLDSWLAGHAGVARALADLSSTLAAHRIGMYGYKAITKDERTCLLFNNSLSHVV